MAGNQLELILSRQLADSLSVPVFIIGAEGDLLFYNEPAEEILGKRFEETDKMSVDEWSSIFTPIDKDGEPISPDNRPLVQTLAKKKPHHTSFWIEGLHGVKRHISATAYPIIARPDRFLGAVAIFWENEEE